MEALESSQYPMAAMAAANLLRNRQLLEAELGYHPDFTPPAPPHYKGKYAWDESKHVIIQAREHTHESLQAAKRGYRSIFQGQLQNGIIPNGQNTRRRIEPERWVSNPGQDHSNYTQPPIEAFALAELYGGLQKEEGIASVEAAENAKELLREMYEPTKLYYEYFDKFRRVAPDDRRMFIVHPHETGRDSDPTYRYLKRWMLERDGVNTPFLTDKANIGLDYLQSLLISRRLAQAGDDMEKARQVCGAVDLMMNCLLVDNLRIMSDLAAELGKDADEEYFNQYADGVEAKLIEKNWFAEARDGEGMFYSTDINDQPLIETTVNNLFPTLLTNLSENQLQSELSLLDESFDTPHPLPSVGTTSRNFDPHYQQKGRIWMGPSWIDMDLLIGERGLLMQLHRPDLSHRTDLLQGCYGWAGRLKESAENLVLNSGLWEFYDPYTGQGYRKCSRGFGWSNLGFVFKPIEVPDGLELEV
jgi:hypothetical protein